MSYQEAFEAAGAVVHDSEWFGSYQGEALFDITYKGERGILAVAYGSCGGCDAWESFVGYQDNEACFVHQYANDAEKAGCAECKQAQARWHEQVVKFGEDYLNGVMNSDEVAAYRKRLQDQTEWDWDAGDQLRWLDKVRPQ